LLLKTIIHKTLNLKKMKSIKILMAITVLLSTVACNAQNIKNAKTETIHIYGNCEMCKSTIEKAGNLKKTSHVDWNKDTKTATLTYDSKKTNQDEILKRIALSGYDSDRFLAPDNAYAKLQSCCQYERKAKVVAKMEMPKTDSSKMEMHNHTAMTETTAEVPQSIEMPFKALFGHYFALKDALVKTDGNATSAKATDLLAAISAVKMEKLAMDEHTVWMKVMKDLAFDAKHISETKETAHQREHFITLSKNMYALIKVSKQETPTYYQHCPMANDGKGADWLSKELAVKNPYYGSMMLSCGKVVEIIK
jgi:copper chaperone CopZ